MEIINRKMRSELLLSAKESPIVALLGPRQSGKTTLAKACFPDHEYVSLEDLDKREFATSDPVGFLERYQKGAIFDEVQRVPELFSFLQTEVDRNDSVGRFILTGSHQFHLVEQITQSLAGRISLLKLLPFSMEELIENKIEVGSLYSHLLKGQYPRVWHKNIRPEKWLSNYFETYIQKDVRQIKNIGDINKFVNFVKMLAARSGQLLNLSSLGNDCGISHNTASSWLSVLEGSFVVFTLNSHHKNFKKRLVKAPKVYFYDSGLACFLLGISKAEELMTHSMRGGIFEGFIISECMKYFLNEGKTPPLYFWRDKTGNEVDLIIENGETLTSVEIKSASTINGDFFKGLEYWSKLSKIEDSSVIIYGGEDSHVRNKTKIVSWKSTELTKILDYNFRSDSQ